MVSWWSNAKWLIDTIGRVYWRRNLSQFVRLSISTQAVSKIKKQPCGCRGLEPQLWASFLTTHRLVAEATKRMICRPEPLQLSKKKSHCCAYISDKAWRSIYQNRCLPPDWWQAVPKMLSRFVEKQSNTSELWPLSFNLWKSTAKGGIRRQNARLSPTTQHEALLSDSGPF